jgi:hypothetical protein
MGIMIIDTKTSTRFISANINIYPFFRLGIVTLSLGCDNLVSPSVGIRLLIYIPLVTLVLIILVSLPIILHFILIRGVGYHFWCVHLHSWRGYRLTNKGLGYHDWRNCNNW